MSRIDSSSKVNLTNVKANCNIEKNPKQNKLKQPINFSSSSQSGGVLRTGYMVPADPAKDKLIEDIRNKFSSKDSTKTKEEEKPSLLHAHPEDVNQQIENCKAIQDEELSTRCMDQLRDFYK